MKHPKWTAVLFFVGIGCLILSVLGIHSIFWAVGIACLLLSYVANRRFITIDPFTGQKLPAPVSGGDEQET